MDRAGRRVKLVMRRHALLSTLVLLATVLACARTEPAVRTAQMRVLIEYSTTTKPEPYKAIEVLGNGAAMIREDESDVQGRVSQSDLEELLTRFLDLDFFALDELYAGPGAILDADVLTLTMQLDGKTNRVSSICLSTDFEDAARYTPGLERSVWETQMQLAELATHVEAKVHR